MLLNLFELASNKTLQHDPKTQARLVKLQGKTMVLHIKTINQSFSITPRPEGLEFSNTVPESVDVTLKATVSAMAKIGEMIAANVDGARRFSSRIIGVARFCRGRRGASTML